MKPVRTRATALLIASLSITVLTTACTTATTRTGYLSSYDAMSAEKGIRGRRIATPAAQDVPEDAPLFIETVQYAPDAQIAGDITESDRARLVNQFGRALCAGLSKPFAIGPAETAGAYRLRAAITEARATGQLTAAVSTAMSFGLPIGVRPPMGLGGFAAEMEVIAPDGRQVAAMVWKQRADMASAGPRISRIGDAYDFAGSAADDFSQLFPGQDAGSALHIIGVRFGEPDDACSAYGEESSLVGFALGLVGVAVPPEISDHSGAQPRAASAPSEVPVP